MVYLLFCKGWSITYNTSQLKGNIFNLFTFNPIPQSLNLKLAVLMYYIALLRRPIPHFRVFYTFWYQMSMHANTCTALHCRRQSSLLTWHLVYLLLQHVVHLFIHFSKFELQCGASLKIRSHSQLRQLLLVFFRQNLRKWHNLLSARHFLNDVFTLPPCCCVF